MHAAIAGSNGVDILIKTCIESTPMNGLIMTVQGCGGLRSPGKESDAI
jgi:hypothetical protein